MSIDFNVSSLFDVKGKVALVTGGGTGIGKMLTAALAQNGAKVYIASRKLKVVQEAADELNAVFANNGNGGRVIPLQADLTNKQQATALADEIKKLESKLHILVNNAGTSWGAPFENFPEVEGWDRLFALNVKSIYYLTVALTPLLAKGSSNIEPGRVINISSITAVIPAAQGALSAKGSGTYSYNVSKAAVNHLTRVLAAELADRYITVNAIAPGYFPSKMTAYGIEKAKDRMVAGQPMGRIGTPEDMGGVGLFLCSRAASHITGTVVPVDGGALLLGSSSSKL